MLSRTSTSTANTNVGVCVSYRDFGGFTHMLQCSQGVLQANFAIVLSTERKEV
jgi:hypothetical protein